MNAVEVEKTRRNLKKYIEGEIKKVRSGLGQQTSFKFTRNIDNILE